MHKAEGLQGDAPAGGRPRVGRWPLVFGGSLLGMAWAWPSLVGGPAPNVSTASPVVLAIARAPACEPESESRSDAREAITRAKRLVADCRVRYDHVKDYTCTFLKRERLEGGHTTPRYVMAMKARVEPLSFYFKFRGPRCKAGREAIYVAGREGGRILVHDVGLGKLLAGTLELDPCSAMAMNDSRHPISEAGLGHLLATIAERWEAEMSPDESRVTFRPDATAAGRPCTMIESAHTQRRPGFLFQTVRVFIDRELTLPIRFEAYDWPRRPGGPPELVEEYTYQDLRLDVGLTALDFDPKNHAYSFGRF